LFWENKNPSDKQCKCYTDGYIRITSVRQSFKHSRSVEL